ncbi:MAG: hypothetical protein ABSF69_27910 [Polyangiaceae bacterium]|jgi:hypothetical protein
MGVGRIANDVDAIDDMTCAYYQWGQSGALLARIALSVDAHA